MSFNLCRLFPQLRSALLVLVSLLAREVLQRNKLELRRQYLLAQQVILSLESVQLALQPNNNFLFRFIEPRYFNELQFGFVSLLLHLTVLILRVEHFRRH